MISVQHNMLAENAKRMFNVNTNKNAKLAEKLSSGYKINRAADDAAGLAVSEKMRRQVRGIGQAADNIKDGIGYVQTAEGALNEAQDILQRINQLSVKAANGTNTVSDRAYINSEVQQLKAELSRIFSTTTFNEQRIWEDRKGVEHIDFVRKDAVTFNGSSTSLANMGGVTNENCGVLATQSDYTIDADDNGIMVKWTGYDGNAYKTERVSWDDITVDSNGVYSFNMEDYFGIKDGTNKLYTYDANTGEYNPVFKHKVSFTVNSHATRKDIISSINGAKMDSSPSAHMSVNNGDCNNISGNRNADGVYVSSVSLTYPAAYVSWEKGNGNGYNFNEPDEDFIEPASTAGNLMKDPIAENNDNGVWSFSFQMQGIGSVTANSTSMTFYSDDSSLYKTNDENVWWYYDNYKKPHPTGRYLGSGTLATLKDGLTGNRGVISALNGGSTDTGSGSIRLNFTLTPDNKSLTYGENTSLTTVGSFSIYIPVSKGDDSQAILGKIERALNSSSVLDFTRSNDYAYIDGPRGTSTKIDIPVYSIDYEEGKEYKNFWVQAGAEAGQHIDIEYESLSLYALGMQDTDTLTVESASRAINEVKGALQVVSDQRSLFGAYQNRLEHAYNINKNVEENTQASESLIRDTDIDIADAMMEYSINNILLQAGTSMLTQANQSSQLITQLLG